MKKWEERIEKMNDYDKGYLITGIEDGWIDPNMDDWHIYCKLKGIDEHEKTITSGNVFSILFKNGDRIAFNTDHLICMETIYDEDYINAHE